MTDQELIELYKAQRDAAESIANDRLDRIKELEAALAAIEDREAVDADPRSPELLDAYRRGVEDGIERVRAEALAPPSGRACDLALAAFRTERSENQEQTDES